MQKSGEGGCSVSQISSERVVPTFSVVGWGHFYKILDRGSRSTWGLKTCISTLYPPSLTLFWTEGLHHIMQSLAHPHKQRPFAIEIQSWVAEKNIIICPKQTRSCGVLHPLLASHSPSVVLLQLSPVAPPG